jgi:DMSO/TMAO reductase YedYZ molybdopterin-dependent catalytic subunit
MELPPGQRAVRGFPRFGIDRVSPPPRAPEGMNIEVSGQLARRVSLDLNDLARLPRREVVADFHCVAGWSAVGLRWEGVLFRDFYRLVIEPALAEDARVGYLVFVGLDDYRSIVMLEDALADDVLIADRLDGEPLPPEHGAPVRLVSPRQYGYISTKHLCRIELHRSEPFGYYHPWKPVQRALSAVRPHRRARVAYEERRRHLPAWLTRRIYRLLVKLPAPPLK